MKKSTYVIVSLSFCVGALLILSGFLLVKYKTTDNSMITADGYFYLTHEPNKPLEGNINKGIGEIPSVTIPYRHSVVRKYWAPLVSPEFSKNQPIRSGIVRRFTARWPSRYPKNIQWGGLDFISHKKSQFYLARH
ncbi:hypothetical protein ACFLR7_05255 [Acidobacteriota bacterium]